MLEDKELFPDSEAATESTAYINGGDGSMVLDHEIVFVCTALASYYSMY